MKDTLRVLVGWKCNLKCDYCCNRIPEIRQSIEPVHFRDVSWDCPCWSTFCISGGEPLLDMKTVRKVCNRIPDDRVIILYTNGTLLTRPIAKELVKLGVTGINVGLHMSACKGKKYLISGFAEIIENTTTCCQDFPLNVRYHVQDVYEKAWGLSKAFPYATFRFWKLNDCQRDNEERIILR